MLINDDSVEENKVLLSENVLKKTKGVLSNLLLVKLKASCEKEYAMFSKCRRFKNIRGINEDVL